MNVTVKPSSTVVGIGNEHNAIAACLCEPKVSALKTRAMLIKKVLKATPAYSFYRYTRKRISDARVALSPLHRVEIDGVATCFATNDPFSHGWFFPRYRNGRLHEEVATIKFVRNARNAVVIADVGANLGWFTCVAATANRDAAVYSFELDHTNVALCKRNVATNKLSNVTVEQAAVSNKPGTMRYGKAEESAASAMHRLGNQEGKLQESRAITLDEYFRNKDYPSLVKIDVEGAEQLVLEGMHDILRSNVVEAIFIEVHPRWLADLGGSVADVLRILTDSGFAVFSMDHRSSGAPEKPVVIGELETIQVGGEMLVARRIGQ